MNTSFIFPGQGSQKVGMCAAFTSGFAAGRDTLAEIEDSISFKISSLINEGPEDELTLTQNAQIAIFAVSMAVLNVLRYEFGFNLEQNLKYVAGHSLGEYTALCAASVLPLKDAAILVRKRGILMSSVATVSNFCMCAILNLEIDKVEEITSKYQTGRNICVVANDNSDSQVIVSGTISAVEAVSEKAIAAGAKKILKLNTSGPFHSPLMASAAIELDFVLASFSDTMHNPRIPIVTNVTASPIDNGKEVHPLLVRQMTDRVRWRESVNFMLESGITHFVEIGPGKVLTKLSKRAHSEVEMMGIETIAEMEAFLGF